MSGPRLSLKRGLAEFVIVVLGVGTALAAESWRSGLSDRQTERDYLTRLHAELVVGRPDIQNHHARQVRTIAAMEELLALEIDGSAVTEPELSVMILNTGSYEVTSYSNLHDQTYGEMLATGTLGLVRDPEVREAITKYYQRAYRVTAEVDQLTAKDHWTWQSRVRSAMGTMARRWFSSDPMTFQLARPALEPSGVQAARLTALLTPATGWADEVREVKSRIEGFELVLSDLLAQTDALIELLAGQEAVRESS